MLVFACGCDRGVSMSLGWEFLKSLRQNGCLWGSNFSYAGINRFFLFSGLHSGGDLIEASRHAASSASSGGLSFLTPSDKVQKPEKDEIEGTIFIYYIFF